MFLKTILLILATPSIYAATPINGLYTTGFGGLALLPGNIDFNNAGIQISNSHYDSGYNVGGAFGYKTPLWHYEAELSYLNAALNGFNINNIQAASPEGRNQGLYGLANLYFDIPARMNSVLQSYIGAGIGAAWLQNTYGSTNLSSIESNNGAFAYQGTLGINFNFSEAYSLSLYYRYLGASQFNATGNTFQAHLINGGISYRFDINEFK